MARASDPTAARHAATWIVRRLRDSGHVAYFAGGCVRDALLSLHPTDYDVATDATPARVRSLFNRTQEVGAAFGVVLVHALPGDTGADPAGQPVSVEVATFRSDGPYSDARRPDTIAFSDPRSDAERRDFTVNALFLDPLTADPGGPRDADGVPLGSVIDFVGGLADLRSGTIRAVGDPDKRLAEDHLRALRAVRFAARLGFSIAPATAAAVSRHAAALRGVSRERIGDELRRMLAHGSRESAAGTLQRLGLDSPVLEESHADAPLRLLGGLKPPSALDGVPTAGPARAISFPTALAAWATDRHRANSRGQPWIAGAPIPGLVSRHRRALCLSNEESEALRDQLGMLPVLTGQWEASGVAARKRLAARDAFHSALSILAADEAAAADRIRFEVINLAMDGIGLVPPPMITGDDLVLAGFSPGPRFKRVLEGVYDAQLEGRIRDKAGAMELARRLGV